MVCVFLCTYLKLGLTNNIYLVNHFISFTFGIADKLSQ